MRALTMYRPTTMQNALCDFDRYFESFFGDSMFSPTARVQSRLPAVDVRETEDAYALEVELPGYEEKDIEVHVDGSSLSIASKQEDVNDTKAEEGTWILRERRGSSFSRSFKLPENANPEEVTAEFKNGVLSMEIKKREEAKKRTIQITTK